MTSLAERIAAVPRPRPRAATVASWGTLTALLVLGVVSVAGLGFNPVAMAASFNENFPNWAARAFPLTWPGWAWEREGSSPTAGQVVWKGWEDVGDFWVSVAVTLGIVLVGTLLAALVSIPIAYGAARNTAPNAAVMYLCRAIGVVARAVPAIAFASIFVFLFSLGPLPGILAYLFHSIGMISKMFADAIEQIDEGPRTALRSTGASKAQQFWSGVVPQVFPAWIAIGLHRADINLRETVILGYVGVSGLGLELANSLHALNYKRAIPIAIAIIVLCICFEIVSSVVRARLLGVRPEGRGLGDVIVRHTAARFPAVRRAIAKPGTETERERIANAMHRPWTGGRIASAVAVWSTIAILVAAFVASQARWSDLFTFWPNLPGLLGKENLFWGPGFFGSTGIGIGAAGQPVYTYDQIWHAILVTFQVAFAATLLAVVLTAVFGTLAARNVAPNGWVRNVFRGILLIVRGIPELLLAIMFIIATGLGAQAGTLALGIGSLGLLGKLVADSLEEVPNGPERAITAVGGTRFQRFFASTAPLAVPSFVGHTLYVLEQNVRAATLLGIVGGGGIGLYLYDSLRVSKYDQAGFFILLIIVLVLAIEGVAMLIRRALK